MNVLLSMHKIKCLGDLEQPVRERRGRHRGWLTSSAGIQPVLEAATGQKLHYDERMALQGADIENLDNMRMTELNERADLAGKTIEKVGARRSLVGRDRKLEYNVRLEMVIGGQVNPPHTPLADPPEDLVPALRDLQSDPGVAAGSHNVEPLRENV
jgi:hypothetical protein